MITCGWSWTSRATRSDLSPTDNHRHPERYSAKDLRSEMSLPVIPRSLHYPQAGSRRTLRMTLLLLAALWFDHFALAARTGPFIIGADISWVPEDEAAGATYFDHGVQKDIFTIFKDHGFSYIRLRIFVGL